MKMKTTELVNQKCNYFENVCVRISFCEHKTTGSEGEFVFKSWQWQIAIDRRCVPRKERREIQQPVEKAGSNKRCVSWTCLFYFSFKREPSQTELSSIMLGAQVKGGGGKGTSKVQPISAKYWILLLLCRQSNMIATEFPRYPCNIIVI